MARHNSASVNFLDPVQDRLLLVEDLMHAQADEDKYPDLNAALQHLLASGGKRIRPALALLTGGMLGGDPDRLVTLAAAIELLHTATLVHDDLIDGAFLRRGIATLNAQWTPAATVLTGDFIFARAARLAAQTGSVTVMQIFSETLAAIVGGELTQMFTGRGIASRENYEARIYAKTASMFELATSAAAILSEAGPEEIEKLRCYGYSIGMAFQIVDDILDFTGEQATVGKPVASDLRQGLVTLPALYYLAGAPDDADFAALLAGRSVSGPALDRLVAAIRSSGAIQASADEAVRYIQRGLEILETLPYKNVESQALEHMAHYIVNRQF